MNWKDLQFPEGVTFLVTGGAGFIGSNLCEALLGMGLRVRCLDDLSTGFEHNIAPFLDNDRFEFIRGDIRDYDMCVKAVAGVAYVLHQAAWGSVPRSIEMPLAYCVNNVVGTVNLLEACRVEGVKRFVYASSSSVYGDEPTLPKVEGREGNVLSPYAASKACDELFAGQYTRHYGVETFGLRYFNVFGRRQDPDGAYAAVIPKFIKLLLADEAPTINGDGLQSRDFTYIDNVIDANLKACLAPAAGAGQAYNVAFGGEQSLLEVYRVLCEALGKDIAPHFGPDRAGDVKHSNADISKTKASLAYDPQVDFAAGIALAIDWYRANL
ncbi:MAG: SDR family oxidoreductase [Propionibacteriaceae bacterium]|nr:SDR family oxidoreductase [Propionibacteriaceae bacterium]